MFRGAPLNSHYLELTGTTTRARASSLVGETQARSVEFYLDFMVLRWPSSLVTATDISFAGSYPGYGWIEANMPPASGVTQAPSAAAKFGVSYNSGAYYSETGTIYLGKRHVMYGWDQRQVGDGPNAILDGTTLGTGTPVGGWTAVEAASPYDTKGSFDIGYDDFSTVYIPMRVYECWVKINGILIQHYRPSQVNVDNASTTLADESQFGNNATISGTVNTDYRWKNAWSKNAAMLGGTP